MASAALLRYAPPPAWLRLIVDAWTLNASPARMATPATPRIAIAITSSTSVSPRWSREWVVNTGMSHIHLTEDAVHRRDQRDRHEPDDQSHDDDDDGLE